MCHLMLPRREVANPCLDETSMRWCAELCPKGHSPYDQVTGHRTISFTTGGDNRLAGYFNFYFDGETFRFPAHASEWSESQCKSAFESLRNVQAVNCTQGSIDNYGGTTYTVVFRAFPEVPYENNIFHHYGDPPLSSFGCVPTDIEASIRATCVIRDLVNSTVAALPGEPTTCAPL